MVEMAQVYQPLLNQVTQHVLCLADLFVSIVEVRVPDYQQLSLMAEKPKSAVSSGISGTTLPLTCPLMSLEYLIIWNDVLS